MAQKKRLGDLPPRPGRRAPTLSVVAARAGVSIAIASRVSNGLSVGMTPETRARVEAAIVALGYRPNRVARSLRMSRHYRIALLAVDTSPAYLADPFNTYVAAGISNTLSDAGYGLLLQRLDPHSPNELLLERAQESDGLAVYLSGEPQEQHALLSRILALDLPLVVMQQHGLRKHPNVCVVRQDDRAGGRWLGERIRARGARYALAVVPRLSWPAIEERLVGFREALHGVCKMELFRVEEANLASVASDLVKRFFTSVPDVVIGGNDLLAAQAIQALHYHHLRVPNDVGVTGFNALPTTGVVDPPLVTVRSSAYQIGMESANLLLGRLKTDRFAVPEMVLPVEPVQGGSL